MYVPRDNLKDVVLLYPVTCLYNSGDGMSVGVRDIIFIMCGNCFIRVGYQ